MHESQVEAKFLPFLQHQSSGHAAQPSDPFNSLADDATMYFHAPPPPGHALFIPSLKPIE
jgi:hypothetical protein